MSDNLIVMNIVCISIMMIAVFITGIRVICCLEGRERKENKSVLLTDHVIISTNVQAIRLGLMLEGREKILIATMFILCVLGTFFGIWPVRYVGITFASISIEINTLAILIAMGIGNLFLAKADAKTAKMVDFLINKKYTYIISGHWSDIKEDVCKNPIFSITESAYRDTDYVLAAGSEKADEDMAVVMRLDSSKSEGMRKIYAALTYNTEIVIRLVQDL